MLLCHRNKNAQYQKIFNMKQNTEIQIAIGMESQLSQKKEYEYNQSFQYIAFFYSRLLNAPIDQIDRIRLELIDNNNDLYEGIFGPRKDAPRIIIRKTFGFSAFETYNKKERRQATLETLYETLKVLCTNFNYDFQPFQRAYEKVKELDYQNKYIHGKLKTAPDRTHKAGVHIRVEEEHAVISALVQDGEGNETARIEILRTLPHYMFIYKFIYQTKWLDKDRFQINDKSGQVVFAINVAEQKATLHLQPKNLSLPELVQEVTQAVADKSL